MAIEVGDDAPDFDLKDPAGESVKLSDFREKQPVLVVFYPFTFTGVCEGELCTLRDDFSAFDDAGVQVLAISCDSKNAQKVWTEQLGIPYPVLSDFWPHGEVAKAYGVFNDALGCANRATFLVGTDGKVADAFASDNLGQARPAERYEEALAKL
jgi:mycoredoxin-dependent peroxiredoxin